MPSRDDSWLRPPRRDQYDSTETIPFGEWLRRTRANQGMDAEEANLSDFVQRGTAAINAAAQAEMDAYLNGGKKPAKE